MNKIAAALFQIQEPFAAGFFEDPDRTHFYRIAKAVRRFREVCALPPYQGEPLYPNGPRFTDDLAVAPHFSYTFLSDQEKLAEKDPTLAEICQAGLPRRFFVDMDNSRLAMGNLYVHANPNFRRILQEGLHSYRERVLKCQDPEFRDGCLEILDSIQIYLDRCIAHLKASGADEALIRALEVVPMQPATSLYEAMVAWNFLYYIDLCDNVGDMDQVLDPYYRGEDITGVLRQFFRNVDANDGWSLRIGPTIYPISRQILLACKGIRRPSVELCIEGELPEDIWELSAELVSAGSCNPSFYNYPRYQEALRQRFPQIPQQDLDRFAGCGCTETMLSGISRVGSVDGAFHLLYSFSNFMREELEKAASFEEFYQGYMQTVLGQIDQMYRILDAGYRERAVMRPNPIRTVLIDDCIDKELDFNAGGARWSWGMVNFVGSINVIESLLAIRELIFEKKAYTPKDFLSALEAEDDLLYKKLKKCPHYGQGNPTADKLAAEFLDAIFSSCDGKQLCFGLGILSSSVQFTTYVPKGRFVPATPDGRRAGEPLCDSLSPIMDNGKGDVTTMLSSVTALPLVKALGTPVVNLRLKKESVGKLLKPLVLGYFENGGMQLQITCISRQELLDAMEDPANHRDLMVRVGGYSEYFVNLSRPSQLTILARTEYEA